MHYNILVLEGGGAKGPYEMGVLESLEEILGMMCKDCVQLVVSTSVGTVIASFICTGKKNAKEWGPAFVDHIPLIFKSRGMFSVPRYDHDHYVELYEQYAGKNVKMADLAIWLMSTSVDRCEPRTHFFKSWEKDDGQLLVTEIAVRSFAAPLFFGAINGEVHSKVWIDGGMGYNNLPLAKAYI